MAISNYQQEIVQDALIIANIALNLNTVGSVNQDTILKKQIHALPASLAAKSVVTLKPARCVNQKDMTLIISQITGALNVQTTVVLVTTEFSV